MRNVQGCLLLFVFLFTAKSLHAQCFPDFMYDANGLSVQFISTAATSGGSVVSHYYNFGDGSVATTADPVHHYPAPGFYLARYAIQNSLGNCADTIVKVVQVNYMASQVIQLCPPSANASLRSGRFGNTYQWQVSTDSGIYSNIINSTNYSGTETAQLQVSAPSSFSRYRYRCLVDSVAYTVYTLQFINQFTGSVNALWNNPANWSCGTLPDSHTDVVINGGTVTVNSNVVVRSLMLENGAVVTVSPGVVMTVLH
jgi:hypothetical protein